MLARLHHETRACHAIADADRLDTLGASSSRSEYLAVLSRIYGFERSVETAMWMTIRLDEVIDVRDRAHLRLLRADLRALGVVDASKLPRATTVITFRDAASALGWVYAVERNTLLHAHIDARLRARMPTILEKASAYLVGNARSCRNRLRELGVAMDRLSNDPSAAERIVAAAHAAFRAQHRWYDLAARPKLRLVG